MFDLDSLLRPNIKNLKPYSSARDEFTGEAAVFLDANENSFGSPLTKWYNRYPDPLQRKLKDKIAVIKNIAASQVFLGNGSDECIDLLMRAFCRPGVDNIIICPPTYGMYKVSASINEVLIREVPLLVNFQLDLDGVAAAIDDNTKMIFLCSPNNPTGNNLVREDVEMVLNNFTGLVIMDEAYINFSRQRSLLAELSEYPNLAVMQTFSKAWGLAALRLGLLFGSEALINILNKVKPPYNINQATQDLASQALERLDEVNLMIQETVEQRELLASALKQLDLVHKVFPSDANFLLVKVDEPDRLYAHFTAQGIVVRNRSRELHCEGCLRITVGTPAENKKLVDAFKSFT